MKTWVWTVLLVTVVFIAGVFIAYPLLKPQESLRVYQPSDINPRLVDKSKRKVKKDHTVADFKLLNQFGDTITQKSMEGKIYVADFFFTTCPTICIDMSKNMRLLQDKFAEEPMVKLLSHSVTPEIDSVPVLFDYGERYGAIRGKWELTTGDKKHIYELARQSYFAVLDEGDGGVQDFIHTENFVLVDPDRRLRGFYDGTDSKEVERLTRDIRILIKEYTNQ